LVINKQKELSADVEAFGGLALVTSQTHSITNFCNKHTDQSATKLELYGEPKSKRRDSIRNKIQHWRSIAWIECRAIVEGWQILPSKSTTESADEELAQSARRPPSVVNVPAAGDFTKCREPAPLIVPTKKAAPEPIMSGTQEVAPSRGASNGGGTGTKSDPCKLLLLYVVDSYDFVQMLTQLLVC